MAHAYSIIQKSQLEGAVRIDAEYYQPEYLEIVSKVSKIPHDTLENISESLLSFGAYSLTNFIQWKDSGIPFITAEDVKEGFINLENPRFIDEKVDEILEKSRVHENEVLLAMSGKVGDAAVAVSIPSRLNSNQDVVKIKLKKNYSPYFLAIFLNSKFGRKQVLRLPVGSVQQHIFLWQTKSLLIPKFSKEFILKIEQRYKSGLNELQNSKIFYQQAEKLLLKELGLADFKPREDLSFIANLSEVEKSNRVDSDFFQPKYEEMLHKIMKSRQSNTLIDNFDILRGKNFAYAEDGEVGVIKTKQLGKQFISFEVEDKAKSEIIEKENLTLIKNSDVIFASMGVGSLGKTNIFYEFENERGKFTIDSTLRIFRYKENGSILPEVLSIYLSSWIGQELIYKYVVGSSGIISIYENYLESFPSPILEKAKQKEIAELVRKSHEARKKSKELLEEAKRKVEEMIEKGNID